MRETIPELNFIFPTVLETIWLPKRLNIYSKENIIYWLSNQGYDEVPDLEFWISFFSHLGLSPKKSI